MQDHRYHLDLFGSAIFQCMSMTLPVQIYPHAHCMLTCVDHLNKADKQCMYAYNVCQVYHSCYTYTRMYMRQGLCMFMASARQWLSCSVKLNHDWNWLSCLLCIYSRQQKLQWYCDSALDPGFNSNWSQVNTCHIQNGWQCIHAHESSIAMT